MLEIYSASWLTFLILQCVYATLSNLQFSPHFKMKNLFSPYYIRLSRRKQSSCLRVSKSKALCFTRAPTLLGKWYTVVNMIFDMAVECREHISLHLGCCSSLSVVCGLELMWSPLQIVFAALLLPQQIFVCRKFSSESQKLFSNNKGKKPNLCAHVVSYRTAENKTFLPECRVQGILREKLSKALTV